jgi:hypothetical protein
MKDSQEFHDFSVAAMLSDRGCGKINESQTSDLFLMIVFDFLSSLGNSEIKTHACTDSSRMTDLDHCSDEKDVSGNQVFVNALRNVAVY